MEFAGAIVSGGLLLAASSYVASHSGLGKGNNTPEGNAAEAKELYDQYYNEATKKEEEDLPVILAHRFTNPYEELQTALLAKGVSSTVEGEYLHINLQAHLLTPTFQSERTLLKKLVQNDLLLCPGEAFGLETPGTFVITVPVPIPGDITSIVEQLMAALSTTESTRPNKRSVDSDKKGEEEKKSEEEVTEVDSTAAVTVEEPVTKKARV